MTFLVFVVFDDIIVAACDDDEHDATLRKLLERARRHNVRFNKNKLQLRVPQVRYLGHLLTKDGIKPDPEKVSAIVDMSPPTDKKGVHRLIGMLKYLSKFLPNFSDQSKPLRDLLRNDVSFVWLPEHQQAEQLKSAIVSAPVLCYFDPQKPVTIQTDSSSSGLGSCLLQEGNQLHLLHGHCLLLKLVMPRLKKNFLPLSLPVKSFTITSTSGNQ